jgi:hypothetical protein
VTSAAGLSIVILTEDSGQDGRPTVEALARRMLDLVVPRCQGQRIQFVPRDPAEEAAMRGNLWKSDGKNPVEHQRRVRLRRYLVRQLSLPGRFVLFHIDGDRPWRERHTSENSEKFERFRAALPQVADRGRANNPRPTRHGATQGSTIGTSAPPGDAAPRPELRLEHLILICPYRSIEAWLYQNVPIALDICRREHRGAHLAALQVWEDQRAALDELPAPEKAICLGKAFNLELATRGFPAREAYDVQKSFAASVDRLRGCTALVRALELTRG